MAYDTQELLVRAEKIIPEKNLVFIEEVAVFLGISISTFYSHFKKESKEYKRVVDLLNQNAVTTKHSMRNNWRESENATLQISLMKLIGTDTERDRLTQNYNKNEHSGAIGTINLDDSPDALKTLLRTFDAVKETPSDE